MPGESLEKNKVRFFDRYISAIMVIAVMIVAAHAITVCAELCCLFQLPDTSVDIGATLRPPSSIARMSSLNMQLPRTSPAAMFGKLEIMTELIPVKSSGKEAAEAVRTTPIQVLPIPIFSAITSP